MIFYRRSVRDRSGPAERVLGAALLAFLAVMAIWIGWRGGRVEPDLFSLKESALAGVPPARPIYQRPATVVTAATTGGGPGALLHEAFAGPGWKRDGPVQVFGPERLYEKIDGREGLYKSYGFKKLWSAAYVTGGAPEARLDVEIFQQGSAMQAFGVLSAERGGASSATAEADRTRTPNGLYLVCADYYVRLVGSEASAPIRTAIEHAAKVCGGLVGASAMSRPQARIESSSWIGSAPVEAGRAALPKSDREPGALPGEMLEFPERWTPARNPLVALGADPATLRYQAKNGLGMEFFEGLYLATLRVDGCEVKAFLFTARDGEDAKRLASLHAAALGKQGVRAATGAFPAAPEGAVAVRDAMLNTWEWTVPAGRFVTGVTETECATAAARTVATLAKALGGAR